MSDIIQADEPKAAVLHTIAREIKREEIPSKWIQGVISRMKAALASQPDGVGLAAPQIGEPLRIFIVAGRALLDGDTEPQIPFPTDLVCINPEITKLSRKREWLDEGCLSVRYKYGKVRRATKATIHAYDEHGNSFVRGASGLLAHIFQHEVDHLNGILFTQKARDLHDLTEEELEQLKNEHRYASQ